MVSGIFTVAQFAQHSLQEKTFLLPKLYSRGLNNELVQHEAILFPSTKVYSNIVVCWFM